MSEILYLFLMILSNTITTLTVIYLMVMLYKGQEYRYLKLSMFSLVLYQIIFLNLNTVFNQIILTLLFISIYIKLIRFYSNFVVRMYKKEVLESMRADYEKFATKTKNTKN